MADQVAQSYGVWEGLQEWLNLRGRPVTKLVLTVERGQPVTVELTEIVTVNTRLDTKTKTYNLVEQRPAKGG